MEAQGASGAWGVLSRTWGRPAGSGQAPDLPSPAEGLKKLFSGASMASSRGMLVTVGQVGLLPAVGLSGHPGEVVAEGRGLGPQVGAGQVGRPLPVRASPFVWPGGRGGACRADAWSALVVSLGAPVYFAWSRGPSHSPSRPLHPHSCPATIKPSSWSSAPGTCLTASSLTSLPASSQ